MVVVEEQLLEPIALLVLTLRYLHLVGAAAPGCPTTLASLELGHQLLVFPDFHTELLLDYVDPPGCLGVQVLVLHVGHPLRHLLLGRHDGLRLSVRVLGHLLEEALVAGLDELDGVDCLLVPLGEVGELYAHARIILLIPRPAAC